MRRTLARSLLLCGLALSGTAAHGARAAEPSKAELDKAREQFRRGVSLEAASDYSGALAVFKDVALVKSTPQVRFHIAVCQEKLGDLVQALGSYKLAQIEGLQAGAKDVAAASEEAARALEPRIPKLTLKRGSGAAGAQVMLDGRELGGEPAGALPLNPGMHSIRASAPGRKPFEVEVKLEAGESKVIDLVLAAEDAPAPTVSAAASVVPTARAVATVAPAAPPTSGFPFKTTGLVIGGVGVAGLAAAGVFFGLRQATMDELDAKCGADRQSCPDSLRPTVDNGVLYSTLSTATLIAGAGAVVLGGALVIAAPRSKAAASVAVTPGGVIVSGRF